MNPLYKDGSDDIKLPDLFYFRINKDNQMYYTATAADSVILGALRIQKFSPNPTENTDCFSLEGEANEFFLLCTANGKCPNVWKTKMAELMGGVFKGCPKSENIGKGEK